MIQQAQAEIEQRISSIFEKKIAEISAPTHEKDLRQQIRSKMTVILMRRLAPNAEAISVLKKAGVTFPPKISEEYSESIDRELQKIHERKTAVPPRLVEALDCDARQILFQIASGPMIRCLNKIRHIPGAVDMMAATGISFPSSIDTMNAPDVIARIDNQCQGTGAKAAALKAIVKPEFEILLSEIEEDKGFEGSKAPAATSSTQPDKRPGDTPPEDTQPKKQKKIS